MTSAISPASSCGVFFSTSWIQCAARSSGRVRLKDSRKDLASGVRELATITASLIESCLRRASLLFVQLRERLSLFGQMLQQRRRRPSESTNPVVDFLQTYHVGVPHRTA